MVVPVVPFEVAELVGTAGEPEIRSSIVPWPIRSFPSPVRARAIPYPSYHCEQWDPPSLKLVAINYRNRASGIELFSLG